MSYMKKLFEDPVADFIDINSVDIITSSPGGVCNIDNCPTDGWDP